MPIGSVSAPGPAVGMASLASDRQIYMYVCMYSVNNTFGDLLTEQDWSYMGLEQTPALYHGQNDHMDGSLP